MQGGSEWAGEANENMMVERKKENNEHDKEDMKIEEKVENNDYDKEDIEVARKKRG